MCVTQDFLNLKITIILTLWFFLDLIILLETIRFMTKNYLTKRQKSIVVNYKNKYRWTLITRRTKPVVCAFGFEKSKQPTYN